MQNLQAQGGGEAEHAKFDSLLAQLRQQSAPDSSPSPGPGTSSAHEIVTPFQSRYNQLRHSFYRDEMGDEANRPRNGYHRLIESSAYPPAAPTPPSVCSLQLRNSQFSPGMASSFGEAGDRHTMGDERTANLLNLLKFSGGQSHQPHAPQPLDRSLSYSLTAGVQEHAIQAPAPASAEPSGLLAALMKGHSHNELAKPESAPASSWNKDTPPADTQQYLLNLLNKPKPSQSDPAPVPTETVHSSIPSGEHEHRRDGRGSDPSLLPSVPPNHGFHFEHKGPESPPKYDEALHSLPGSAAKLAQNQASSRSFEKNSSSSPADRTPKSSTTPVASDPRRAINNQMALPCQLRKNDESSKSTQDLKRPLSEHSLSATLSPEHQRQKIEHVTSPLSHASSSRAHDVPLHEAGSVDKSENKKPVPEALRELVEKTDSATGEALDHREKEFEDENRKIPEQDKEHVDTVQEFEKTNEAQTEAEFEDSAQPVAQALKKEVGMAENTSVLENILDPETASMVHNIASETPTDSHDPIAESWEAAETDEVIIVEEETSAPVKVYNFPMKPWICIHVQDTEEPCAMFLDKAIMDIARLKKDFDQMDRNLVTASETHLVYGMSKAGGFRVIRQEDGKDARLFTDTKDRIFNIGISTSLPSEPLFKEAIIGTGVSGTVYWLQLRNGDRDYLDDAHPEQYGFVLPPTSSQDVEPPGGVLKTRARTSAAHPEFFAVGRGKSINIIWPAYIFQHNLIKPGHDRVVDTQKLLKQCSLKINTGKAGKDFTFSQDDTIVVSLDKSGRVKFWDIRELTAAREDSDRANPIPAHTSLEVKDPLMILTTTPEGEKAWPTSVLLLDKYRPYQRRTALRYMMVGMKQNHILQLWDLALRKPVQEFNFPHNKESDAVCSVMYHAPTSMIVVGHPTRNSIYFLHLSAPRYGLKSLTQVEYIQRLMMPDTSIPQPESTAVISGIREYSLANKGILRSLDILETSTVNCDNDDGPLFDLYAMHSKGVTCLYIRKGELGWTQNNKVIESVDAVESGAVKITKLNPPPHQKFSDVAGILGMDCLAAQDRRNGQDGSIEPLSEGEEDKRALALVEGKMPIKIAERKEEPETPASQMEKSDRKSRRKKASAAAAAAAAVAAAAGAHSLAPDAEATKRLAELSRSSSQQKNSASPSKNSLHNDSSNNGLTPNNPFAEQVITHKHLESSMVKMEEHIVDRVYERVSTGLEELLKRTDEMQSQRDRDFRVNQTQLLEVVSRVLSENTESVLKNIVNTQYDKVIKPHIQDQQYKIAASVNSGVLKNLKQDLQQLLPGTINQALHNDDMIKAIADKVTAHVDAQINKAVSAVLPKAIQQLHKDLGRRIDENHESTREITREKTEQNENYKRAHDQKMDQLMDQVSSMAATMSEMASSQVKLQQELVTLKQQMRESALLFRTTPRAQPHSTGGSSAVAGLVSREQMQVQQVSDSPSQWTPSASSAHPHAQEIISPQQREKLGRENVIDSIEHAMRERKWEEAIMAWLQCELREEAFQRVLSRYNASFVQHLNPLLVLSYAITLSDDLLSQQAPQKLGMIEVAILHCHKQLPNLEPEVREVVPKIMLNLKTRIEQVVLQINRVAPGDPSLRNLTNMVNIAGRIAEQVQMHKMSANNYGQGMPSNSYGSPQGMHPGNNNYGSPRY